MHIVIGLITAVGGLIWALVALQRAGFDLSDPFAWYRRAQWKKKYADKPLYCLEQPMDVAAVLLLGVAKCEGEISAQQKKELLRRFESEFKLTPDEASDLLLASSHLIRNEVYLVDNLHRILERSKDRFTPAQASSLLALMERVANVEGVANEEQRKLIAATEHYFSERANTGNANAWR